MRVLFALFVFFALPATAQELSSKYTVIGQMDLVIDGEVVILPVATIPADGKSYAEQRIFMGTKALNVTGVSVDGDGEDSRPYVSLVILFSMFSDTPSLASVDYIEPGGSHKTPITSAAEFGTREMAEFSYTDEGALELDFTAELIRTELDDDYNQTAIEGTAPVSISGHVSVVIPDEFMEKE